MTEKQVYEVVRQCKGYEIRRYAPHLVAEVTIEAGFERAGMAAFGRLVSFINGANRTQTRMAMTAPVIQSPAARDNQHVVAFVLPADINAADVPQPTDGSVTVRALEAETAAVLKFSGRWTFSSFEKHRVRLLAALGRDGVETTGPARYARFDPPWTPWFMRHNEVVIPV